MHLEHDAVESQGDIAGIISLFRYGSGSYSKLFFGIGLVICSAGLLMYSAKLMGQLAELLLSVSSSKETTGALATTVAAILVLESLNVFVTYQGRVKIAFATNYVALSLRQALFRKMTRLPMTYYDQQPLGRTITRLTADVEGIESFFSATMPRVLTAFITIVSVLAAMLLTDLKMGLIVCLSSLPALLFTVGMRGPIRMSLQDYKLKSAGLNAKLAELIKGLPLIKTFGLEQWSARTFNDASSDLLKAAFRLMNWSSLIRPISALLCSIPIAVILYWGGHRTLDGLLSIGLLVAFVRYAERYFRPIMQLSFELHLIQDAIASSDRLRKLLDEPEEDAALGPDGTVCQTIRGELAFKDLWMAYGKGKAILKGLNFSIKAGSSIGLVGKTGSGKSTTVHLIPQLYPWSEGDIFLDGVPLKAWNRQCLRKQIGIVSQEVILFHGSLRENLLITAQSDAPPISEEELLRACEKTGLSAVVAKLPEGLNTTLHEGGSNLSMGERQLVAFTRMLLRNPAILILDEATAHVDESCETLIQKAIVELLHGRTCFIIAHRLSTIKHCDRILVYDQGRIVEDGSHEQLLARQGTYAQLVKRQLPHGFI